MRHRNEAILLTLAIACGACSKAYLTAAGTVATAASNSRDALSGTIDVGHRLCTERTKLDYFLHRLEKSNVVDGRLVYWREFPSAFKLDGAESWAEHCKALTTSDAIVEKAVAAIGSYGDTLRMICDGDYSGSDITQLVTDVAALTARLDTKNAKAATSAGAAFAEPIGKLASALAQKYAEGEMAKIVAAADPAVQNLLAGLQKYLEAIGAEQADAERKLAQILHDVDKLVKADNPVDVLALYDLAGRSTAELEAMRTAQSSMLDALKKLAAAQGRLASANGENDSPKLKEVLGLAAEVLNDIAAVNNALKGGGKS